MAYGLGDGQQHGRQAEADDGRDGDADLGDGDEVEALVGGGPDADGEQLPGTGAREGDELADPAQGDEDDEEDERRRGPSARR